MSRLKSSRYLLAIICLAVVLALAGAACRKAEPGPQPPVAEKIKKEFQEFGKIRVDNYYWLKERENPKVIDYLKAENEYLQAVLKPTEALQGKLYQEIVGRIKQTDMSVPYRDNGYYYYTRFEEGKEYPVYCRKKGSLDSPDEIPNTLGMSAWANDNKTVFYVQKDVTTLRPYRVMRHVLGTPVSEDQQVFLDSDEAFTVSVYQSKSKKYVVIASDSTLSTESWILDADHADSQFELVQPRERDPENQGEHFPATF